MIGLDAKAVCCLSVVCCATVGGFCAYRNRRKIPHPSECSIIGKCYILCGCHNHKKFDMLIEVHEIHQVPIGANCIVEVVSGRFNAQTQPVSEKKGKCDVQERLNLHVRQCDKYIQIIVYRKGSIPFVSKSDALGIIDIDVKSGIIDDGFPKRRWYSLLNEGRSTVKVQISFHKIDTEGVALGDLELSPLVQQALLHAQYEAESQGEKLNVNMNVMSDIEKLRFYSKVLEGPLKKMAVIGPKWKSLYFKPVEKKNGSWEWHYWDTKEQCIEGQKPKGSISFLGISVILPDSSDRHCFFMKYHDINGAHDLCFKRVDRDRNLWSDGLYEFIEKLRAYLDKMTDEDKIAAYIKKKDKKNRKGSKSPRSTTKSPPASPRENKSLILTPGESKSSMGSPRRSKSAVTSPRENKWDTMSPRETKSAIISPRENKSEIIPSARRMSETPVGSQLSVQLPEDVRRLSTPKNLSRMNSPSSRQKMLSGIMYTDEEIEDDYSQINPNHYSCTTDAITNKEN